MANMVKAATVTVVVPRVAILMTKATIDALTPDALTADEKRNQQMLVDPFYSASFLVTVLCARHSSKMAASKSDEFVKMSEKVPPKKSDAIVTLVAVPGL